MTVHQFFCIYIYFRYQSIHWYRFEAWWSTAYIVSYMQCIVLRIEIYLYWIKTKRRRSDSVLWQKPLHQWKCQKGKVTTQTTPQKSSIKQRLRTDLGRSVGVTTATQLVWLNSNIRRGQVFAVNMPNTPKHSIWSGTRHVRVKLLYTELLYKGHFKRRAFDKPDWLTH